MVRFAEIDSLHASTVLSMDMVSGAGLPNRPALALLPSCCKCSGIDGARRFASKGLRFARRVIEPLVP